MPKSAINGLPDPSIWSNVLDTTALFIVQQATFGFVCLDIYKNMSFMSQKSKHHYDKTLHFQKKKKN